VLKHEKPSAWTGIASNNAIVYAFFFAQNQTIIGHHRLSEK
jgi:hypothetical protein